MIYNPFFDLPNDSPKRCFVFSVPHNPSHLDATCCAFAQKTRELCWMLKSTGHEVYHFGNELSVDKVHPERGVECDEHITVTLESHLMDAYPNWQEQFGHVDYNAPENLDAIHHMNKTFMLNTAYEVKKRYKPGDFFCYVVPTIQIELWNALVSLPVKHIETGVGYYGSYMPYRVFESSQIQSWHYGYFTANFDKYQKLEGEEKDEYPFNPSTHIATYAVPQYDCVIPNAFDINLFDFKIKKENYLLYLGRIIQSKGVQNAIEIANRLDIPLKIAGPGDFEEVFQTKPGKNIELLGPVGPEERRVLLSDAVALLCPTEYWEPFGGVNIQAMLSGTPPIATNSGGFYDNIRSGYNGYRIGMNKIEQGCWAVQNADKIDPHNLRDFGLRFSKEQIALRYNEYFQSLDTALKHNDDPSTIENPGRENLDWVDCDRKIKWPKEWITPIDAKADNRSDDTQDAAA